MRPPGLSEWRLAWHDLTQEGDAFAKAFVDREKGVLMLDRERALIARQTERRQDALPLDLAMSVADRPENPGAEPDLVQRRRVQNAVASRVDRVDGGVLGVDVVESAGPTQLGYRNRNIDALPEEVAGIEVGADRIPAGLAQAQQRGRVVDDEAWMHLKTKADAALGRERRLRLPVGDDLLPPLPVQHLLEVGRPGAG